MKVHDGKINEPIQTPQAFEAQIEAEFREQLFQADLTQAMEKLNRLGVENEDDIRRFFDENPELATHLQKYLMPTNEDSK